MNRLTLSLLLLLQLVAIRFDVPPGLAIIADKVLVPLRRSWFFLVILELKFVLLGRICSRLLV